MKFDPSGDFLAVGSHDSVVDIYDTSALADGGGVPPLVGTCRGHSSFITHLDWSEDGQSIRTNCGAYELLFWDTQGNQLTGGATMLKDTPWASTSCALGWDVQGIWPKGAMGCQVNSVAKSPQAGGGESGDYTVEGIIATGDNFGKVKLFRWPSPIMTIPLGQSNPGLIEGVADWNEFAGHSSFVTSVVFSSMNAGDEGTEYLISTGGNDDTVILWSHKF